MLYNEKTDIGVIKYDNQIIGNIVKKIVSEMDGRVQFATSKGRILKTSEKPSTDDYSFVDATIVDDEIKIEVYIVVKFGTSINKVADEITAELRDILPKITGKNPNIINIVIKGVVSKNFSKRNIEVKSYADDNTE